MASSIVQPYTKLKIGQVSPICVVAGDPNRAELISQFSDSSTLLSYSKEFKSYDCVIKGVHFTACSHGVGNPGAGICFEELIKCGAKCIIRAGTSGYLQKGIKRGEIFISHGAIREEGTTTKYVDLSFPAVPTPEVFSALVQSAQNLGFVYHTGISLTSDVFYMTPSTVNRVKDYAAAGAKSVSMEESTLFLIGAMHNIWTGVVQVFDGGTMVSMSTDYEPHGENVKNAKENMIKVCLDAIPSINEIIPA